MVVLFWLDLWEIFFLGHTRVWPRDLWIFNPALYHCATVTSGFHLWQFQVFHSGAEGLVVVLFWLDLWEIFFLATPVFELGTSGSLVLHSTTVPATSGFHLWQFQVFNSVQGIGGGIVLIGPVRDFLFGHTRVWPRDLWISSPALYHCATATSGFHLWQFRYLTLVQRDCSWYCSDGPVRDFLFGPHQGLNPWDLWISNPALYHCATVTSGFHLWQFQVFNSGGRGIGGGIVLIGPVRDFLFGHTSVWTGDFWISSPALYHCTMATSGFHLWQFQVFNSGAEGLLVVLFWLDLWEIFFLATPGFQLGTSGSLVLHSTTVPQWLLVFTSDNFRYLTLVQRDCWWYCSDWTCEKFFFLATPGFEPGPLDH